MTGTTSAELIDRLGLRAHPEGGWYREIHRSSASVCAGGAPLAVVPPGCLQAARPLGGWALAACLVAPGFAFADFEIPDAEQLLASHPRQRDLIARYTRSR
jgi:predicted cupin superfamily sugar epimerase